MTADGNIIVDGVLASCYAYTNHDLAHIGMTPIQWFPEVTEWIFCKYNESPIILMLQMTWSDWCSYLKKLVAFRAIHLSSLSLIRINY